jgi:hypothetical protein
MSEFFLAHPAKKGDQAVTWLVNFPEGFTEVSRVMLFPASQRLLQQRFAIGKMPVKAALGYSHAASKGFYGHRLHSLLRDQFNRGLFPIGG